MNGLWTEREAWFLLIGMAIGVFMPRVLALLATRAGTIEDERAIHRCFAHLSIRLEWFTAAPELLAYVRAFAHEAPAT